MPAEYVPERGHIAWLQFDPQADHEQSGKRPALVVSPESYNRRVGLALFCPVTSQVKGYPFEVVLPPGIKLQAPSCREEITCDYNINIANGAAWPCRCGAIRCRREVVGDFLGLPKQWQREYRPLLAEWFVRLHRERIDALDREP